MEENNRDERGIRMKDDYTVVDEVRDEIKAYCKKRRWKCKGCEYSRLKREPEFDKLYCCIFNNAPCNWENTEKEK